MRELHRRAWLSLAIMLFLTISAFAPSIGGSSSDTSESTFESLSDSIPARDWNAPFYDTFSQSVATGKSPSLVAVGDFNNDSLPDIAVACKDPNQIEIFYQQEDGRLSEDPDMLIPLPNPPRGMAAGDISGDGLEDLVVTVALDNRVYLLHQSNSFRTNITKDTFPYPYGVTIADFDGDGKNDFAVVGHRTSESINCSISIHLSETQFVVPHLVDLKSFGAYKAEIIASYDFNGNGSRPDLFISDSVNDMVVVFKNDISNIGENSWSHFWNATVINPVEIGLHDFDGSGTKEFMVVSKSEGAIRLFEYNAALVRFGTVRVKDQLISPSSATMIDMNKDGKLDIVVTSDTLNRVEVFFTPSSGGYSSTPNWSFPVSATPLKVKKVDMNGMDLEDLVVLSNTTGTNGTLSVYYQRDNGIISNSNSAVFFPGALTTFAVGDFERDDANEIAALLPDQRKVSFTTMGGVMKGYKSTGIQPIALTAHKLIADAHDLVVLNRGDNTLGLYWGGQGFFSSQNASLTLATNLTSPTDIDIGDVSGDGRPDIVVACQQGFQIFYNIGETPYFGSNSSFTLSVPGADFTHVSAADLSTHDHLGLTDVALVNASSNKVEIFTQSSDGTPFSLQARKSLTPSSDGNITWMGLGDVEGNGRADILLALDIGAIVVYEQNPNFRFDDTNQYTFSSKHGFLAGAIGDLDDDGADEIAILGESMRVLTIYEIGTSPAVPIANFTSGAGNGSVLCADFNGDLRMDLGFSSLLSKSVSVVLQKNVQPVSTVECLTPNPVEGIQVSFSAANSSDSFSDMDTLEYAWDFGDGNTTSGGTDVIEVEHAYMRDGNYTVNLTVTDRGNLWDAATIFVGVGDAAPEANFTVSHSDPLEGTVVYFNDTSFSFPDEIVNWTWEFGDGNVAYDPNVSHIYLSNGNYEVTLTVTDEDGSRDNHSISIEARDAAPEANFTVSHSDPLEGTVVYFNDTSFSFPDEIVNWTWEFGDGSYSDEQNPEHVYANNGTYVVRLQVKDDDGSVAEKTSTIIVRDTHPQIQEVYTASGKTSFVEDEAINLRVRASQTYDGIKLYEWDLDFRGTFQADVTTTDNRTSVKYAYPGSYTIAVRVWDSDSFAQGQITVEVENVPPVASFSYQNIGGGKVVFDASLSWDTPSDYDDLEFRWNFDDGGSWTPYSNQSVREHPFSQDGKYNVTLQVKDDDGAIDRLTLLVTVDRTPPTVVLIDIGDNAVVGKPIIIKANVTDAFGLESVTLIYRIGNETWNVTMTPSGPGTVYTAQIPSQNSTGSVYFRIAALDRSGNLFLTSDYEIKVGEDSSLMGLYLMALAGSIAFLGVVLYVRRKAAVVDDVFVIFEDGCLLAHETRRLKPGMDDEVLSSMLVAVQSFVKDSFKDEEVTTLKRLDFGEKRILVEKGKYIYLAVVLHGEGGGRVSQRMRDVLKEIEERYTSQLTEWDGDLDKLRGIKQLTDRLLEIRALGGIPIIGRLLGKEKETSDVASEGGPEDLED